MYYNRFTRRSFLKGLGGTLALPLLPSILPKAHAQSTTISPRYIQLISAYGQYGSTFWPSDIGLAATSTGIHARSLSSVNGNISTVLGSAFNSYKNKISVVRGIHVLAASDLHNGSYPTCASGTPEDNQNNGRPVFSYSIDQVLSESSKVYADATGKQRLVNFCPAPTSYTNFSWATRNGSKEHSANTTSTSALFAKFAQFSNGDQGSSDASLARKKDIIQEVYSDYKTLRDSRKLASEDRNRLESYMSLVDQSQKGLHASLSACPSPNQVTEGQDAHLVHRNQANILTAALACGITSVASYILSHIGDAEAAHNWAHNNNKIEQANAQRVLGEKMAYLLGLLDGIQESNGKTLLDNTLVYWGNEYGDIETGGSHTGQNMPIVIAGGGGKIQLGQYIDFRKTGGAPINNFLISLMMSMGLGPQDYERGGVIGFGEYALNSVNRHNFNSFTSTSNAKRTPLMYLYKG